MSGMFRRFRVLRALHQAIDRPVQQVSNRERQDDADGDVDRPMDQPSRPDSDSWIARSDTVSRVPIYDDHASGQIHAALLLRAKTICPVGNSVRRTRRLQPEVDVGDFPA